MSFNLERKGEKGRESVNFLSFGSLKKKECERKGEKRKLVLMRALSPNHKEMERRESCSINEKPLY